MTRRPTPPSFPLHVEDVKVSQLSTRTVQNKAAPGKVQLPIGYELNGSNQWMNVGQVAFGTMILCVCVSVY